MRLQARNHYKGFTLVELLIAISIIAILSVIGLSVYNGVQARARDARRIADINKIALYLEAYHQKTGQYPESELSGDSCRYSWESGSSLNTSIQNGNFLNQLIEEGITDKLPIEQHPISAGTNGCSYRYARVECGIKLYAVVFADLETESGQADERPDCFSAWYESNPEDHQDKLDWALFLEE